MKKSFMKRALATGLSLAMAFSLAATDVNVASAAAKPAMKKASFTVKYGGKTKTYKAKAATVKNFKITKAVSTKDKIATAKKKNTKAITVSPGTKKTGGSCKIKITFQNKKTKKKTTIKVPCTLKPKAEEQKPDDPVVVEKLTMTVEATTSKEIKATFNKAIGSDATITLKKGTSDVANTAVVAEDGKSATITLTGKLTAGTYTVTVVAAEETVTVDVTVEDEKLTKFVIGAALKEKERGSATASAVLTYEAQNQYGEKMNYSAAINSVTVSMAKVEDVTACKTSQAGEIYVKDIPAMLAVPGQSFTVVIVDTVNNTGITMNETVPYGAKATAKEFNSAGVYNTSKTAWQDVAEDAKIENYKLLFTCKDQYGDDMSAKDVATLASDGAIQAIIAGGVTGIKAGDMKNKADELVVEVDDVAYFAVPFEPMSSDGKAVGGSYTVQILNNTLGPVYSGDFVVTSGTVIGDVQINPKDTIYADQENEFDFTVTDIDGKQVTDYATLKDIEIKGNTTGEENSFKWKKNADGTARLVYEPLKVTTSDPLRPYKNYEVRGCQINANKPISGKYYVKAQTFTVYHQRTPYAVDGVVSSAPTVAIGTTGVKLELKHLVILDQYQNPYTAAELEADDGTIGKDIFAIPVSDAGITGATVTVGGVAVTNAAASVSKGSIEVKPSSNGKTKVSIAVSNDAVVAILGAKGIEQNDADRAFKYGKTVTITKGNANSVSGLYIDSVNGGCALWSDDEDGMYLTLKDAGATGAAIGKVVVKGKVNGKDVTLDADQCVLLGAGNDGKLKLTPVQSYNSAQKVITEEREFTVVVDTEEGSQSVTGKVVVSNEPMTAKTISVKDKGTGTATTNGALYTYASADALFVVKSQYNTEITGSSLVTYVVESAKVTTGSAIYDSKEYKKVNGGSDVTIPADVFKTSLNGTNKAVLKLVGCTTESTGSTIQAEVTVQGAATANGTPVSKKMLITFTVPYKAPAGN